MKYELDVKISNPEFGLDAGTDEALVKLTFSKVFKGDTGSSAYEDAVSKGFVGTLEEWLAYLRQPAIDAATIAEAKGEKAEEQGNEAEVQGNYAKDKAREAIQATSGANTATQNANTATQKANQAASNANTSATAADTATAKLNGALSTADQDHTRADEDHSTASNDHTQALSDARTASDDHGTATNDHTQALSDTRTASSDHSTALSDHTDYTNYHTQADTDHTNAINDHSTASQDHTRANQDHSTASTDHANALTDHATAGADHTQALSDTSTASSDHTTAGTDHATALSDHATAGADHTQHDADHAEAVAQRASEAEEFEGKEAERDAAVAVATALTPRVESLESDKANIDGYYEGMGVGSARKLIDDGTPYTDEVVKYRTSGGSHEIDEDVVATLHAMRGNSIVKNQLFNIPTQTINGVTITNNGDGSYTFNGTATAGIDLYNIYLAKRYFVFARGVDDDVYAWASGVGSIKQDTNIDRTIGGSIDLCVYAGVELTNKKVTLVVIDLTNWYNGSVPEGLTADKFLADYPEVLTMGYNAGEIANTKPQSIVSRDSDDNVVMTRNLHVSDIKDSAGNVLYPNGLCKVGSVRDEVDYSRRKAVKLANKYVLTGEERMVYTDGYVYITIQDMKRGAEYGKYANVICNKYTKSNSNVNKTFNTIEFNEIKEVNFVDSSYASLTEWRRHIRDLYNNGTPIELYYELATPIEVDLPRDWNDTYEVRKNGTEEMVDGEGDRVLVPTICDIHYGMDELATIKSNEGRLDSVEAKPAMSLTQAQIDALLALIPSTTNEGGVE